MTKGGPHTGGPGLHTPLPALQAQRYISQLKGQVNALEAELEEQRKQKQKALVDNEQLRHELAQLKAMQLEGARNQGLREEAESGYLLGGTRQREGGSCPARPSHSAWPLCRESQCHGGALQQAEGETQ